MSGSIGDAALGLKLLKGKIGLDDQSSAAELTDRYHLPRPRVGLGRALVGCASAAMDISDGLAQDLSHICAASGVGGVIFSPDVPLSEPARRLLSLSKVSLEDILGGGDDYELLFTAPSAARDLVASRAEEAATKITRIGRIEAGRDVSVRDGDGRLVPLRRLGYRHG